MNSSTSTFTYTLGTPGAAFTWHHLISDEQASISTLDTLNIPKAAKEGLLADETRPKCFEIDNGFFVCLRAINCNGSAEPEDMVSIRIWLTKEKVITTTKTERGLKSIQELCKDIEKEYPIKDVGVWFCNLLEKVSHKISEQVDEIEFALEALEEQLNADPDSVNRQAVINIRKQAAHIKRFISPQREALEILHFSCDFISQIQTFRIKEYSDRVLRFLEELELVRERSILILEELRYAIAEKQNERMYVLSLVTAIFLPLSFLTGVFGMNVGGLPGVEEPTAFIILVIFMALVAALIFVTMKFKRWM
ncbi:CorA family divalent cation transporter [Paraglaciecola sp.]|uniref:CorA family divalent cation transporter n=1 Tax=Paraglaciecola sp. TaxID=1920173 RepID=UPI003EF76173